MSLGLGEEVQVRDINIEVMLNGSPTPRLQPVLDSICLSGSVVRVKEKWGRPQAEKSHVFGLFETSLKYSWVKEEIIMVIREYSELKNTKCIPYQAYMTQ